MPEPDFQELLRSISKHHENVVHEKTVLAGEVAKLRSAQAGCGCKDLTTTIGAPVQVQPEHQRRRCTSLRASQDVGSLAAMPMRGAERARAGRLSIRRLEEEDLYETAPRPSRRLSMQLQGFLENDRSACIFPKDSDLEIIRRSVDNEPQSLLGGQAPRKLSFFAQGGIDSDDSQNVACRFDDSPAMALQSTDMMSTRSEATRRNFRHMSTLVSLVMSTSLHERGSRSALKRGLSSQSLRGKSWLINPEHSRLLQSWDMITVVALAFVAVVCPVQVAILPPSIDWLFFVSAVVDIVFLVDLVLQFFIMFPKRADFGFALVDDHSKIVKNYLQTWFLVDTVSVIPFDIVAIAIGTGGLKILKMIRLLRLLKLARMVRASRIIRRFEMRMSITYSRLSLMKFFVVLAVLTHWLANLWALTLVFVEADEGVPRWIDAFTELEENISDKTGDTPWKLYFTCLYFTSYTITSVGYGDIGPANMVERVVCTVMIVISGTAWAVVLGQVSDVVGTMNSDEQAFQKCMDELNGMMHDRVVPLDLQHRLRNFFMSNKAAQRRARHEQLMSVMSPGLRAEVAMELNRPWISKVHFLQQFDCEAMNDPYLDRRFKLFIADVSRSMTVETYCQSETFGKPQVLCIVNCGLVSRGGRLMTAGMLWGKDFVLSMSEHRSVEAAALTYVEVTVLHRSGFLEIVEQHKERCPEIAKRIRRYCCWTAFQLEIWREAQRRLALRMRSAGGCASGGIDSSWPNEYQDYAFEKAAV